MHKNHNVKNVSKAYPELEQVSTYLPPPALTYFLSRSRSSASR